MSYILCKLLQFCTRTNFDEAKNYHFEQHFGGCPLILVLLKNTIIFNTTNYATILRMHLCLRLENMSEINFSKFAKDFYFLKIFTDSHSVESDLSRNREISIIISKIIVIFIIIASRRKKCHE